MESLIVRRTPAAPEPLSPAHNLGVFDCGIESLNLWLKQRAIPNGAAGASRTFVVHFGGDVIGYYTLAAASVQHSVAAGRIRRNMPNPIPAALLARLAIDRRYQNDGLGHEMLGDAVMRVASAARNIGMRALLVDVISDDAKRFYAKFGFRESAAQPSTMLTTIGEIQRALGLLAGKPPST